MIAQVTKIELALAKNGQSYQKITISPKWENMGIFSLFRMKADLNAWYDIEFTQKGDYWNITNLTPVATPNTTSTPTTSTSQTAPVVAQTTSGPIEPPYKRACLHEMGEVELIAEFNTATLANANVAYIGQVENQIRYCRIEKYLERLCKYVPEITEELRRVKD